MAKILLYAATADHQRNAQLAAARALFEELPPAPDGLRPLLSLLVPLADDPFANLSGVGANPVAFVIEMALPPGQRLQPLIDMLQPHLQPLLAQLDRRRTEVLVGYHRALKVSGKQTLIYHYLMHKRPDFCTADYLDYYANHHGQFGLQTPGIDYYQTYKDPAATTALAERWGVAAAGADNVSEMHMDNLEEVLRGEGIEDITRRAIADEESFVDRARSSMFTTQLIVRRTL